MFRRLQWLTIPPSGEIQRTFALKELRAAKCHFSSLEVGGVRTCCVELECCTDLSRREVPFSQAKYSSKLKINMRNEELFTKRIL